MHQKKYTRKRKGGKAIGSGGFGCIFRPALNCTSHKYKKQSRKRVSKLGLKYSVEREMHQLLLVKKYIKKISNYKKYFLLNNIDTCRPAPLTKKDKVGFDKCFTLKEHNITEKTVNDNLQQLMIINMPYGGLSLSKVIEKSKLSFGTINKMLQRLLLFAILPMNKLNVYHLDLKADNILYKDSLLKIIDFGEIGISTNSEPLPSIGHRPIQFNSPFSNILFSDYMNSVINAFLHKTNKSDPKLYEKLRNVIELAYESIQQSNRGHELYLVKYVLPNMLKIVSYQTDLETLLNKMIVDYCTKAVYNYIDFKRKTFDKVKYFNDVYSKNVDVYGWIMCYVDFIVTWKTATGNDIYNDSSKKTKLAIMHIIMEFCFSDKYAARHIPIDTLLGALNSIDSK